MLPILRKFLNSCHITSKMKLLKVLEDTDENYCVRRAQEAIMQISLGENIEENYKLAIQLLNIGYYKHCQEEKSKNNNDI